MLRDLHPKRRKMEEPLLGKINTLTEKTTFFFCGQNNMHKIYRVKNKNLIKNEHWVGVGPGSKKWV
jgi:hypothetical protein